MSNNMSVACSAIHTFLKDPSYSHFHWMLNYYSNLNSIDLAIDDASFGRHINKKGLQEFSDHYWDKYQIHFEINNKPVYNRYDRNKANWPNWVERIRDEFISKSQVLTQLGTFRDLYNEIDTTVQSPAHPGFGELYSYDVSLRIGSFLKLEPDEVYIHAGVKKGLEKLFDTNLSKLNIRRMKKKEFVDYDSCFDKLSCKEIECFLCVAHVNGWF